MKWGLQYESNPLCWLRSTFKTDDTTIMNNNKNSNSDFFESKDTDSKSDLKKEMKSNESESGEESKSILKSLSNLKKAMLVVENTCMDHSFWFRY